MKMYKLCLNACICLINENDYDNENEIKMTTITKMKFECNK